MITAITITTMQKELKKNMLNMNPKPDVWILYIDHKPKICQDCGVSEYMGRVASNYNQVKQLVPSNSSHVLIMEDDIELLNSKCLQMLLDDLIEYDCDVITTAAKHRFPHKGRYIRFPMVWDFKFKNKKKYRYWLNYKGIRPVDGASLNFVLMKREVIENITFYGFNFERDIAIDEHFYIYAKKLGYKIYCDFNIRTSHRGIYWNGYDRTIPNKWFQDEVLT